MSPQYKARRSEGAASSAGQRRLVDKVAVITESAP
jgi:hypothetical protein